MSKVATEPLPSRGAPLHPHTSPPIPHTTQNCRQRFTCGDSLCIAVHAGSGNGCFLFSWPTWTSCTAVRLPLASVQPPPPPTTSIYSLYDGLHCFLAVFPADARMDGAPT